MDFSAALTAIKDGARAAREGWNAGGQFVVLQKGYPDGIPINANTAEATGIPQGTVGADGERRARRGLDHRREVIPMPKTTKAKFWVGLAGALVSAAIQFVGPDGDVGKYLTLAAALLTAIGVYAWPNKPA